MGGFVGTRTVIPRRCINLLVSLAAVFVSSRNPPPRETAAHIRTTFLSNCFINPQKLPIIYKQSENDVSFRAENDLCDFRH